MLAIAGTTSVLAGACGKTDRVETKTSTGVSSPQLEGTVWALTEAAALGVDLGKVSVTARFDDGRLVGQSGCNDYTAAYKVDGAALTIGPNITGTKKACSAAVTSVEAAYLDRLPRVTSYKIDGLALSLADADGKTLLSYTATVGTQAMLGTWTVISYYSGDAVTSVVGGTELTTTFGPTEVTGNAGCNSFSGPYEANGDTIRIGRLSSTRAACATGELQKQEDDYLAALQLATTFQVTGTRLDLFRPGGTYAATLDRA